jgi:meso-butanediol dehydrogenase / (S,S)-butanediol dehydrogenase / diacetyl reductase
MKSDGRLKDKVAIITGAGSGIGKSTAILFVEQGARVVLADLNEDGLRQVQGIVDPQNKGLCAIQKTDVSREQEVKALVELALDKFSKIDILVNNAGITGDLSDLNQQNGAVWHSVYDVNVLGAVYAVKYAVDHMRERKSGAVVNVASVAGIRSGAGGNAYSASKAALINFTQTSACDLGGYNIRVNAVCPGLIETGMTKPVFDYARQTDKIHKVGSRCELRRYGLPVEIGYAILFLASDEASFITGQALAVDGGNTASLNLPGMKA